MTPDQYCEQQVGNSGSSFAYSFYMLPRDRKPALRALYAFCRVVDDVVDGATDPEVSQRKLHWWYEELERMFTSCPRHPITQALLPHTRRFELPLPQFQHLLDGVAMDFQVNRFEQFDQLLDYCRKVASSVGILTASILGYRCERTLAYAANLGVALQLTNIIRDVGEDAGRGRIYLPLEELDRFKVSERQILEGRDSSDFFQLMQFQHERTEQYYAKALEDLDDRDRRAQVPGLIMAAIYHRLLRQLRRDGFDVLRHKTSLSPALMGWIAVRTTLHEYLRRLRSA